MSKEIYNENKHLAAIALLDALKASNRAYYLDPTEFNKSALQACDLALKEMLAPYWKSEKGEERP